MGAGTSGRAFLLCSTVAVQVQLAVQVQVQLAVQVQVKRTKKQSAVQVQIQRTKKLPHRR